MSEDHGADRARLLGLVPDDGSAIGNTALMRTLGVEPAQVLVCS
jgi:hypothetical protein